MILPDAPLTITNVQPPKTNALIAFLKAVPFILMHVACFAILITGVHTLDFIMCGLFYFIRMFGITAGYHRYFAHRAYKTSRWFQFVLAWLGCMSLQKGPLWWAAHHRHHHKYSDTEQDLHSPITGSFWWSHIGWVVSDQYEETNWSAIRDFVRFPELRLLNTMYWIPGIILAVACWVIGGFIGPITDFFGASEVAQSGFSFPHAWSALVVGFFVSTVLLYHGTFCVNSVCHIFGFRRYATTDKSRNNWWVALVTLGEGWHNNHHYYQSSANQGFFWWEIDISYYMIKLLAFFGIVWAVRKPPENKLIPPSSQQPVPEPGT